MILSSHNFEHEVIDSSGLVLVLFWAEWCKECTPVITSIHEMAQHDVGITSFGTVDVDKNHNLAHQYNIDAIPTLLLFKKGRVAEQLVGWSSRKVLESKLAEHVTLSGS